MRDLRLILLAAFQTEHREHLEYIREALAKLEETGKAWDTAELDEVFRRAHSLKGAARAVDAPAIEVLAHRLETLFGRVRGGAVAIDADATAVIHRALNAIEDIAALLGPQATQPPPPIETLDAMDVFLARSADAPVVSPTRQHSPRPHEAPPPPPSPPPPAARPLPEPEPPAAEAEAATRAAMAGEDMVRIGTADLDRLLRSAGQLLTEGHGHEVVSKRLRGLETQIAELDRQWKRLRKSLPADAGHRSAESLDTFAQTMRGLAKEARGARIQQSRGGWTLRQLASGLQQEAARARMVPVESVFGGFRKMMRDIARDEGKDAEFRISGLEVRVDRMVLQTLKDPVMHMLRNALYHGIEPPAERERRGKPRTGRVSLRFEILGNRLALTIEDDGRGIDVARIAEVAVENGFLAAKDAASADAQDIARHIFRPGFSTAGHVTDLAGRGMGMSVVYQAVAKLNGSLDLPISKGAGACFRLLVPLSVATHRLMLVECQGRYVAIPTDGIERLCRFRLGEVRSVEGRPMVHIEGRQLFLVGLAELLDLPDAAIVTHEQTMPVMVLRSGDARVAVAVDGFVAIRDGLIQELGFPLPANSKVSGGTLMEDGTVVIVASPFQLVESCRTSDRGRRLATVERSVAKKVPTILVVDDSFTTRTLEKSILVAHGYQVHVAVDGLEALNLLRAQAIDLVVADVQMPRLDGFGLLKEVKRDKALAKTPVILVTSLESREDRERGLGLGASAYVVKRKFDQRELLETIEQLL